MNELLDDRLPSLASQKRFAVWVILNDTNWYPTLAKQKQNKINKIAGGVGNDKYNDNNDDGDYAHKQTANSSSGSNNHDNGNHKGKEQ